MQKRTVRNWKHNTKNRHPYGTIWMPDCYGDWKSCNRKGAKLLDKHNSPFMQDEFDAELLAY